VHVPHLVLQASLLVSIARLPPRPPLFPYTTLFRSLSLVGVEALRLPDLLLLLSVEAVLAQQLLRFGLGCGLVLDNGEPDRLSEFTAVAVGSGHLGGVGAQAEVRRDLGPPQVRARLPDVAGGAQVLRGRVRIGVLPALGQGLALARLRVLGLLRALAVEADLDARIRGSGQEARGQPRLPLLEVVAGDDPFGDRLRRGTDLVRVLPVLCLLRPVAPLLRVHTEQQLVVIG